MKQLFPGMVIFTVLLIFFGLPSTPADGAELELAAKAAVLVEMQSGKILWGRNKDLPLPPASTVKILTAVVVLEHSRISDRVKVASTATLATGSTVRLQRGEHIAIRDLLYALLVGSGNDAATALALHVAGSVTKFSDLMNRKARRLGALHSRFGNPTGLPQKNQLTTAQDLAAITKTALETAEFRTIVATKSYPWKSARWEGTLKNSNQLLETYEGAIGVKTGNTREAGYCLVAAAKRGEAGYIAVVLNSSEKAVWLDAKKLLDFGFANFTSISLLDRGETVISSVVAGTKVPLVAAEGAQHVFSSAALSLPQIEIVLDELAAPLAKGEKVGEAVFRDGKKEIARVDLISKVAVPGQLRLMWIFSAGALILLAFFLLLLRARRRRHRYIFAHKGNRLSLR